jgi:hypothetical protein
VESRASVLLNSSDVFFGELWAGVPLTGGDSPVTMGLSFQVSRVAATASDGRRTTALRMGPDIWGIVQGRGDNEGSYHAFVMRLRQPVPVDRVSNWFQRLPGETSIFRVVLAYDGYLDLGSVKVSVEGGVGNADLYGGAVILFPIGERVALGAGATLSASSLHTAVATVRLRPFADILEIGASMSLPLRGSPLRVDRPYPTVDLSILGPQRRRRADEPEPELESEPEPEPDDDDG